MYNVQSHGGQFAGTHQVFQYPAVLDLRYADGCRTCRAVLPRQFAEYECQVVELFVVLLRCPGIGTGGGKLFVVDGFVPFGIEEILYIPESY